MQTWTCLARAYYESGEYEDVLELFEYLRSDKVGVPAVSQEFFQILEGACQELKRVDHDLLEVERVLSDARSLVGASADDEVRFMSSGNAFTDEFMHQVLQHRQTTQSS